MAAVASSFEPDKPAFQPLRPLSHFIRPYAVLCLLPFTVGRDGEIVRPLALKLGHAVTTMSPLVAVVMACGVGKN